MIADWKHGSNDVGDVIDIDDSLGRYRCEHVCGCLTFPAACHSVVMCTCTATRALHECRSVMLGLLASMDLQPS